MRNKTVPLLIASVVGVLAAVGVSRSMLAPSTEVASVQTVEIFVSVRTIDVAEAITPDKVRLEKWPIDRIPKGVGGQLANFEGKFARQRFYEGEPIMAAKLMDAATDTAQAIPRGFRVVSMPDDGRHGAPNPLRAGDRVDVVAYFDKSERFVEPIAKTVLTGVQVFAIDASPVDPDRSLGAPVNPLGSISLLIQRSDAPAWTCATELGTIRLALASPTEFEEESDEELASRSAADFLAWLSQHQPAPKFRQSELLQTAAMSSAPTLVSVPAPIALPTPTASPQPITQPESIAPDESIGQPQPIAQPRPVEASTEASQPGFKMLKVSGGVETEYWFEEDTPSPVTRHDAGHATN
ncbi:Flp pilus assembly protein CpaB [Allorhodopirellula solitaria]|uniref:SAF domain-containing protein n=1 Tax=Allorhodopirellula solitaria TaxID=2527987 RepID=A0A5C5YJJ5_9BACT|nr:Flp pilus assembly protein CpaB [Allorhodopirellula solitaria]TWT74989.1 hypothetical protein CA85_02770 [Allorhodopirellula solitaria]